MIKLLILFLVSFLIGSIPFGIIIAKAKGVDLRKAGSGNIGATNVLRSLGKSPALFTLLGDILKGTLAVAVGRYFGLDIFNTGLVSVGAILGHNFSIFLGFKGGKGVATSIGVLILYSPIAALITIVIWLFTAITTRYSSLGAIVSFCLLPLNIYFFDIQYKEKILIAFIITILLIVRHRDNIYRLLRGTERKIGERA